ncbi:MAG TPA: zf-HC2 domain-containing protein, partial [Steroidobacteraceae bacterium]|nr:zf-HC2 domain-containing protein [Steroidobacteraceae bacterium]
MSHTTSPPPDTRDCEAIAEMLAWHANGSLGATDRQVVDSHTAVCDACRTMLALERRIVESIRAPRDNVEQSPHAGWQKLTARLDQDSTQPHVRPASNATSRTAQDSQPRHGAPATVSDLAHASAQATRPRRANWSVVL